MLYLKPLIIGALSYVPPLSRLMSLKGTGSTSSSSYCYGVWLKHLAIACRNGMQSAPVTFVELGPGDTLGVGIAALLCGAERLYALDALRYASPEKDLGMVDEIAELLRRRAPRPDRGWPDYDDCLDARLFPSRVLTDELLDRSLAPARVARIKNALAGKPSSEGPHVNYVAPWSDECAVPAGSADMIISHAVLQSVHDLEHTYAAMARWLSPRGYASHQIDYACFNTARSWNGHWAYGEALWKIVAGRRPYLINRQPHSAHLALIKEQGLEVACELRRPPDAPGISRADLAPRWQQLSDEDLDCRAAFVLLTRSE